MRSLWGKALNPGQYVKFPNRTDQGYVKHLNFIKLSNLNLYIPPKKRVKKQTKTTLWWWIMHPDSVQSTVLHPGIFSVWGNTQAHPKIMAVSSWIRSQAINSFFWAVWRSPGETLLRLSELLGESRNLEIFNIFSFPSSFPMKRLA